MRSICIYLHCIVLLYFSLSNITTDSPVMNLTTAGDRVLFYLAIYGGLAGANSLFTLLRAFLFAYGGICAAQKIHKDLLNSILKVSTVICINVWIRRNYYNN